MRSHPDTLAESARHSGLFLSEVTVRHGARLTIPALNLGPLRRGELVAVIGPNGAGKSTLLRAVAGLGNVSGKVFLNGDDLARLPRSTRARRVAYMPQAQPPAIALSALEAVLSASPIRLREDALRAAYETLDRLNAAPLAMTPLSELSGGQRQIVALAQALVRKPEVLLLDEPTSALDLRHQIHVMDNARSLARESHAIVVAVLHDISLALRYADRIAVLRDGRLTAFGAPAEIISEKMLADIYGIAARIERCSQGTIQMIIDSALT